MRKPVRLAVLFDQKVHAGGGYQQALNAAMLVKHLPKDLVKPVYFTTFHENIVTLSGFGISAKLIELSIFTRAWVRLRASFDSSLSIKFLKNFQNINSFEQIFEKNNIDLIYFLSPNVYAKCLEKINYITTVWDLCHRDDPEFPEVRWDREFETRENNYKVILPRAVAIIVDSELGKKNVVMRYGIDDSRVHVIPFEPSLTCSSESASNNHNQVDITSKFGLNVPYIFYPAQFWAHKNHVYLLEGLKELEVRHGLELGVIFCGGDKGNKQYVTQYATNLGLSDRVRFAGFVPDEELVQLYKQSVALVMPTYFGPTNLPPLEAFEIGVPVLYSNKAGLSEQIEGAGLLMDLNNPATMAQHLFRLCSDPHLRSQLIKSGREKLTSLNKLDRTLILKKIIEDFYWRRLAWA